MLITAGDSKLSGSAAASSGSESVDSAAVSSTRADDSSITAPASTSSSSQSSTASSLPPPQLSKVTAFEFMQAWNGLKGTTDIEQYVNILDQIQPSDISKGTSVISWIS